MPLPPLRYPLIYTFLILTTLFSPIHNDLRVCVQEVCTIPKALITSGGGFSDYVTTPSYQSDAVSAYLKSGVKLPPATEFNKNNRGFPDVSALGHNYLIAYTDEFEQVDGYVFSLLLRSRFSLLILLSRTSCSSPVFAAIIALLNSYRQDNGKASLGFVVPLLYQAYASDPTIFNDITTGDNKCTENCCAKDGFLATKGWDPVCFFLSLTLSLFPSPLCFF